MIVNIPIPCPVCGQMAAKLVLNEHRRTIVHRDTRLPHCELPK